jgi:hypothetical protein
MENLFSRLEQLLGDFVSGFLNRILETEEYQTRQTLPVRFSEQYRDYLKQLQHLQYGIESYQATTREETHQRNRALAILKSSSEAIISTFHFEDH